MAAVVPGLYVFESIGSVVLVGTYVRGLPHNKTLRGDSPRRSWTQREEFSISGNVRGDPSTSFLATRNEEPEKTPFRHPQWES